MDIRIHGVSRHFHSHGKPIRALDGVSLDIPARSIFTLLGPSGCGKTTLLRCIVGLDAPDEGEIAIGGEIVFSRERGIFVPPEKRGLGMVFQTYAIWPHMSVFQNVAYPLEARGLPRDEIREQVRRVLAFVQLSGLENRPATRLSGGQQQRVALARALVAEPRVILFDEPLSNLDAKLREETRKELRAFLSRLHITAVYVTHDRTEALSLSDRIAVMKDGRILEVGTPREIYFQSARRFVADFIGRANLIEGRIRDRQGDLALVDSEIGPLRCAAREGLGPGSAVTVCIRPENLRLLPPAAEEDVNRLRGTIESLLFVGEACEGEIRVGEKRLLVQMPAASRFDEGIVIDLGFAPREAVLLAP
ncbi:MAG: ABC transporter ATP-binding protein [Desulfobacterales bacterium]